MLIDIRLAIPTTYHLIFNPSNYTGRHKILRATPMVIAQTTVWCFLPQKLQSSVELINPEGLEKRNVWAGGCNLLCRADLSKFLALLLFTSRNRQRQNR